MVDARERRPTRQRSGRRRLLATALERCRPFQVDQIIPDPLFTSTHAITIDAPATDARATIWAAFKHDVGVYFYWHAVHWRHNSQKQGDRNQNVWANSITFDNRGQPGRSPDDGGFIHGDGVLLYPGEEKLHPAEDRGVPGPIATIQLANFRRGLQDHQYLTLAKTLGLDANVDEALKAIVPRVFSDATDRVSFPESGDPYEVERLKLARAIVAAQKKRRNP